MSSILDALKKTQASINQQSHVGSDVNADIKIPSCDAQNNSVHTASLLKRKKKSSFFINKFNNPFSFLNRHVQNFFSSLNLKHFVGSTIFLFLCAGIWLGYRYDQQIIEGAINTINHFKSHANSAPVSAKPTIVKKPVTFTFNGTIRAGSNRDAMINNQLYHVGEEIDGYKILEIHYDQVILRDPETKKSVILKTDLL